MASRAPASYPLLHALNVPELRDALVIYIGDRGFVCRSRLVCKTYARVMDAAMRSLSQPLLLLAKFFARPDHAAIMFCRTGTLFSGDCVRIFIHSFCSVANDADLLVSGGNFLVVLSHLHTQGYRIAPSAGTLEQYERERRWLSSESLLLVGGPSGRQRLNIIVCADEPVVYLLRNPLPQNMQAFDGERWLDLYPVFGRKGPRAGNGIAVQGLDLDDIRLFVPRARRLGTIVPPDRTISTVHRFLGDSQSLILSTKPVPTWLSRNLWEVRLHVNILRDGQSWVVFDASTVTNAVLGRTYAAARDLGHYVDKAIEYTLADVTLGLQRPPADWDKEMDVMITAYRSNTEYAPARLPKQGPFYVVSYCVC